MASASGCEGEYRTKIHWLTTSPSPLPLRRQLSNRRPLCVSLMATPTTFAQCMLDCGSLRATLQSLCCLASPSSTSWRKLEGWT